MFLNPAVRIASIGPGICTALILVGCGFSEYQEVSGMTMGTYYRVIAQCPGALSTMAIDDELLKINAVFSTFDPDSSISRFNRESHDQWVSVEPELAELVSVAAEISELTGGAFDLTIAPLVNAWGFGPGGFGELPEPSDVEAARSQVDFRQLEHSGNPPLLRKDAPLEIDASGIAKGYGVDLLLDDLADWGCENSLVDIGGEVGARGTAPFGRSWKVGIEAPDGSGQVVETVQLTGSVSLATSGNYRSFIEVDGERLGHAIDPRTGYPVRHVLTSVSVVHRSAAQADALATALLVLGKEKGMRVAEEHHIAAIMIVGKPIGGGWRTIASRAAKSYVE